jgi:hypothetical protein
MVELSEWSKTAAYYTPIISFVCLIVNWKNYFWLIVSGEVEQNGYLLICLILSEVKGIQKIAPLSVQIKKLNNFL